MESPHLYDSADYKKGGGGGASGGLANLKFKGASLFTDLGDYDLNCDLTSSETSVDLHHFINEDHPPPGHFVNENLIQELQSLNVDKSSSLHNSLGSSNNQCPRGIGGNSGGLGGVPPPLGLNSAMYGPLAYMPQSVHSGSQFDRQQHHQQQHPQQQQQQQQQQQYHDRAPIKQEPGEHPGDASLDYSPCARVSYSGYGGALSPYPMTPTTVSSVDSMSSLKSPSDLLMKGGVGGGGIKSTKGDKDSVEYRRRRERNNIAVRKSREKAKERSRETEERVKRLTDENKVLQQKCHDLDKKVARYKELFEYLPEPLRSEVKNQMEIITSQHPHQHQPHILGL